jgi:uncharacterized protein YjiS (DUF1127 family)
MAFLTGTHAPTSGFAQTFAAFWERARHARKVRVVYNVTYDELARLSDRDLADLGIHRSQISAVAKEAAEKI